MTRFPSTSTPWDAIINVNSLFTLAVFVGLAWNPNDPQNNLNSDPSCAPSAAIAENLVAFHVYSFSSFLFSSLIALALKQAIRLSRNTSSFSSAVAHVNRSTLRLVMLVSGIGSVSGCAFLMLALANVVQIKLGTLACGSSHTFAAIVPLFIFVPIALLIYVSRRFVRFHTLGIILVVDETSDGNLGKLDGTGPCAFGMILKPYQQVVHSD
ncbi:hypothetical protein SESBI_13120 [Sesbania bispinosa]|nr:hypothetical protein SESBI_13120 [Sesbania bispinosa]